MSTENKRQELGMRLVEREIITNCSTMVSEVYELANKAGDNELLEDTFKMHMKTAHVCLKCEREFSSEDDAQEHIDDDHAQESPEDIEIEERDNGAFEHWIVSTWLYNRLEERGEIVGELFGFKIWGRTCSGQAIALDSVIQDIAEEYLK